jgi:hypothetical protein
MKPAGKVLAGSTTVTPRLVLDALVGLHHGCGPPPGRDLFPQSFQTDLQEWGNDSLLETSDPYASPAVRPTDPSRTTTMTLLSMAFNVLGYATLRLPLLLA